MTEQTHVVVYNEKSAWARFAMLLASLASLGVVPVSKGKKGGKNLAALTPSNINYAPNNIISQGGAKDQTVLTANIVFHFLGCNPIPESDKKSIWCGASRMVHENIMDFLRYLEEEHGKRFSPQTIRQAEEMALFQIFHLEGLETFGVSKKRKAEITTMFMQWPD